MTKVIKISALGVAVMSISGCASLELMAVGGVSYLLTGKGLTDHAVSAVMEKDCALHHLISDKPYCAELANLDEPEQLMASNDKGKTEPAESLETDTKQGSRVAVAITSSEKTDSSIKPHSEGQVDLVHSYAVVGSFNDLKFAYERSVLYRNYNTLIVENSEASSTRFRVVVGPLQDKSLMNLISVDASHQTDALWTIELCSETLTPPPCSGTEMLAQLPSSGV